MSSARPSIELHPLPYAEGSAIITMGDTRVLCAASVEERVPPFRKGSGRGWVTAEYAMLPRSTQTRSERDGRKGTGGRARPGDPAADRPQPSSRGRFRGARRAQHPHRLRRHRRRRGNAHRVDHRRLRRARAGSRAASRCARPSLRPAALAGRRGERRHRGGGAAPRPLLPRGLGCRDRHELRRIAPTADSSSCRDPQNRSPSRGRSSIRSSALPSAGLKQLFALQAEVLSSADEPAT